MSLTLLPLLLATAASAGLSLDVSTPQQSAAVGEPIKLVVRWKADQDLQRVFVERGRFQDSLLSFVVDDGRQLKTYRELTHDTLDVGVVQHGMKKGAVVVTNLILVHGRYEGESPRDRGGFLFRAPGTYAVKAVYTDGDVSATSSAVRFTITEPSDEDREVLEAARARPRMLGPLGLAESQAKLMELIKAHPRSPYLRFMRLRLLESRLGHPDLTLAPDTRDRLGRYDQEGLKRHRAEHFQKIADEVFAEAEWGPFEEEALALVIKAARAAGDKDKEDQARNELLQKYPDSATVREMQEKAAKLRSFPAPSR